MENFRRELEKLINRHCKENDSDTPDFILAKYIERCLDNYAITVKERDEWFKFEPFSEKQVEE